MLSEMKIGALRRAALEADPAKRLRPGTYLDGDGLYLQATVNKAGGFTFSWLYRFQLSGRRREMGLGSLVDVGPKKAREEAAKARVLVLSGIDPINQRNARREAERPAVPATKPTFKQVALEFIATHQHGWRNAKHAQQWENTLTTYAFPVIGNKPVDLVDDDDVLAILKPMWTTKTETATRVRSRIEQVLDAARAEKLRTGENPARWRGHLALLLPKPRKVTPVVHHPALPFAAMPLLMARLRERMGISALCLEWVILTACRSGEALGARWDEVDLDRGVWTIPASRMKANREHRVPLSFDAMVLLTRADDVRQNEYIFPGVRDGRPMSNMALNMLLRELHPGITVHGFRSSFRDWAAERTTYPNEMAEMALAHTIGNAAEAAYRRGDMVERRRAMMDEWAEWCEGKTR
jgi:integrase